VGATVRLLGPPRVDRDAGPGPAPRGNKAWALLAHLVLGDRPPTRAHLVSLLFAEAADPLGALRWNTSELRRSLHGLATLGGNPLTLRFAEDCTVDVRVLLDGSAEEAAGLDTLGLELLEGVAVPSAPAFEAWLAAERTRVAGCSQSVLVERALDLLAAGSAAPAARLAARAVALDPLVPDSQAVLVRSLSAAGDHAGARRQAERCTDLFRRELGCAAPAEVLAAASEPPAGRQRAAVTAAAVRSFLEAGQASLTAGAVGRGLEQLRRAAGTAVEVGEPTLRAQAFVALAAARIHGTGERGTAVQGLLQEAAALARQTGAGDVVAAACRELGFVAVQRGQHDRALVWLEEGRRSTRDDAELARLLGVRGMCLSDGADHAGAHGALSASVELARRVGDARQEAWSLSLLGRVEVLRGGFSAAADVLDRSLGIVAQQGWTAFRPWPEAFRAEAAIGLGDLATARDLLDSAWVLATESDDHCWMATVAHGSAALALAEGDPRAARRWCDQGLAPAPWYLWPHVRLLEVACGLALTASPARALPLIDRLTTLAARASMRDLLERAHGHRARAGLPAAGTALPAPRSPARAGRPVVDRSGGQQRPQA
jgi:DNA-binding SARP family transcriptional activator